MKYSSDYSGENRRRYAGKFLQMRFNDDNKLHKVCRTCYNDVWESAFQRLSKMLVGTTGTASLRRAVMEKIPMAPLKDLRPGGCCGGC